MKTERFNFTGEIRAESPSYSDGGGDGSTDGKPAKRWLNIEAYSGDKMDIGWGWPVVLDLSRLDLGRGRQPILWKHDPDKIVGYCADIINDGRKLSMKAKTVSTPEAERVLSLADEGYPWQASVGADPIEVEFVDEGDSRMLNGRSINGPFYNVAAKLRETSVVTLGADADTLSLAASRKSPERAEIKEETKMLNAENAEAIKAEFKDDPQFALDAILAGKTLVEAKADYADKLRVQINELKLAAQKPAAKAPESNTPIRAEASERAPQASEPPMDAFRKLVASFESKGLDRDRALSAAVAANRDLHKAVVQAANSGR